MVQVELTAEVDKHGRVQVDIQLPESVEPGQHRLLVTVVDQAAGIGSAMPGHEAVPSLADLTPKKKWSPITPIKGVTLDPGFSMRRSDWYEDDE